MSIHRRYRQLIGAVLVLSTLGGAWCRAVTEGTEVTAQRLERLRGLVRERFTQEGLEAAGTVVAAEVLKAYFAADPGCPSGPRLAEPMSEEECRLQVAQITRELVARKYPGLDLKALEAEAAAKYPIYTEGEIVEVEFQFNPARRERLRGVYEGRSLNSILVGRRQIMISDMAAVEGNGEEILKFDVPRSRARREAHVQGKVRAYEQERDAYAETVQAVARREHYRLGAQQNEARGYLFYGGAWRPVREAVPLLVESERAAMKAEAEQRERAQVAAMVQEAEAVTAAAAVASQLAPGAADQDPVLAAVDTAAAAELEAQRAAEAAAAAAAEAEAARQATDAAAASAARQAAEEAAAEAAAAARQAAGTPPAPTPAYPTVPGNLPRLLIAIAGVVVALSVIAVLVALWRRRRRDPARFFQGKGKTQREFWAMAEGDPEHFRYVAYRFPTLEDARAALLRLSFLSESSEGQIKSSHNIQFGCYPHQDKFVSFVGGTEFGYALWREASALLPELAGAEYFRVSPAPGVQLEIPDIEQLLRDEQLHIEHVENREGEGEDYSQYFIYRAPDKQSALEFLKRARIAEASVHVVVQTPEGTWGKDENGIYQE